MELSLNHVSIRTLNLEACQRFYVDALGLVAGPRPDFPFPGIWLYAGPTTAWSNAVVHVIGIDPQDPSGLDDYLGPREGAASHGSGVVDHVAFQATGLARMRERLAALGIALRERAVPGLGLHQLFLEDPDGLVVELNYPAAEN
jgi:catechol 2,3-dioxygenase-like lactoylglutathione lyase family enzyme